MADFEVSLPGPFWVSPNNQESIGRRSSGIYLAARYRPSGREDIERFSNIEVAQKQDAVVKTLKLVPSCINQRTYI
jgi:hypothetical protein